MQNKIVRSCLGNHRASLGVWCGDVEGWVPVLLLSFEEGAFSGRILKVTDLVRNEVTDLVTDKVTDKVTDGVTVRIQDKVTDEVTV